MKTQLHRTSSPYQSRSIYGLSNSILVFSIISWRVDNAHRPFQSFTKKLQKVYTSSLNHIPSCSLHGLRFKSSHTRLCLNFWVTHILPHWVKQEILKKGRTLARSLLLSQPTPACLCLWLASISNLSLSSKCEHTDESVSETFQKDRLVHFKNWEGEVNNEMKIGPNSPLGRKKKYCWALPQAHKTIHSFLQVMCVFFKMHL